MTPTQELQLEYWKAYTAYLWKHNSELKSVPHPKSCYEIYYGGKDIHLEAIINSRGKENRAELYLTGDDAKKKLELLKKNCEQEAEKVLGKLIWSADNHKRQKVYLRNDASLSDKAQWQQQFEWLRHNIEAMHSYFIDKLTLIQ